MPKLEGQRLRATVGPIGYRGPGGFRGGQIAGFDDLFVADELTQGPSAFPSPQTARFTIGELNPVSIPIYPQLAGQSMQATVGAISPNGGVPLAGLQFPSTLVGPGQTAAGRVPLAGQTLVATQGSITATVTPPVSLWDTSLDPSFATGLLLRRLLASYDVDTRRQRGASIGGYTQDNTFDPRAIVAMGGPVPWTFQEGDRSETASRTDSRDRSPNDVAVVDVPEPDPDEYWRIYVLTKPDGTVYQVYEGASGISVTRSTYSPPAGATAPNVTGYRFEQLGEVHISATVQSTQAAPPAPGTRVSASDSGVGKDVRFQWTGPAFATSVAPAIVMRATSPAGNVSHLVVRSTNPRATYRTHDLPNRDIRWLYGTFTSPVFSFVRNRVTSRFDIAVVDANNPGVNLTDFTIDV